MSKTNQNDSKNKNHKIEEKIEVRKRINNEWLIKNGYSSLEEVRKRIEGINYVS